MNVNFYASKMFNWIEGNLLKTGRIEYIKRLSLKFVLFSEIRIHFTIPE